jgi:hypothetical protein
MLGLVSTGRSRLRTVSDSVILAAVAGRVVQVIADQVVEVVDVPHARVIAAGTVNVIRLVKLAVVMHGSFLSVFVVIQELVVAPGFAAPGLGECWWNKI